MVIATEKDDMEVIADWFEWNAKKGRWSKATLKKGEYHHLQRSSCYKINKQSIFTQEYSIAEPTPNDIYIKGSSREKT